MKKINSVFCSLFTAACFHTTDDGGGNCNVNCQEDSSESTGFESGGDGTDGTDGTDGSSGASESSDSSESSGGTDSTGGPDETLCNGMFSTEWCQHVGEDGEPYDQWTRCESVNDTEMDFVHCFFPIIKYGSTEFGVPAMRVSTMSGATYPGLQWNEWCMQMGFAQWNPNVGIQGGPPIQSLAAPVGLVEWNVGFDEDLSVGGHFVDSEDGFWKNSTLDKHDMLPEGDIFHLHAYSIACPRP